MDYQEEIEKMKKAITQLEVDRERLSNDAGKTLFLSSTLLLFLLYFFFTFQMLIFICLSKSVFTNLLLHIYFLKSVFSNLSFRTCVYPDDQRVHFVGISEELKMKETQLDELKKQLVQWEGKLRQQQQLYEAVRSDRNHYSKGNNIFFLRKFPSVYHVRYILDCSLFEENCYVILNSFL